MWDGLAPLVTRDLGACWHTNVHAVDASEWGLGVCKAELNPATVRAAGRFSERWRFREKDHANARAAALQHLVPEIESSFGSPSKASHNHVPDSFDKLIRRHSNNHSHSNHVFRELDPAFYTADWKVVVQHRWRKMKVCPSMSTEQAWLQPSIS